MAAIARPLSASALPVKSVADAKDGQPSGLTGDETHRRLEKFGPNAMPDTSVRPFHMALEKFWAPVPGMLEAAIVLELVLGKYVEAAIIAGSMEREPKTSNLFSRMAATLFPTCTESAEEPT